MVPLTDHADVVSLLRALRGQDPGRPRLTWYGPGFERIELSTHVLENWVAKTANLLVTDLDVEPGDTVLVDLPPHWRTGVWFLALWAVGAHIVVATDERDDRSGDPAEVVGRVDTGEYADPDGTDHSTPGPAGWHVAVALEPLAVAHPHLPTGAVDYAAEVGGQGDVFVAMSDIDGDRPALTVGTTATGTGTSVAPTMGAEQKGAVMHRDLLAAAADVASRNGWTTGHRVLDVVAAPERTPSGPIVTDGPTRLVEAVGPGPLARWLAPLTVDGSLVLVHPRTSTALQRIAADEQVSTSSV